MKEKKKIGKLLELLNEYDSGWDYDDYWGIYQYGMDRDAYIYHKYYALSKSYGFIKWLVENDKIDFENMEGHGRLIGYLTDNMEKPTRDKVKEELVIMLLSISNTPIEDLISYLK